jgi:uncharacterized protein
MILVEIINVVLSDKGFVVLKNNEDDRVLPIFVDKGQAQAIVIALSKASPERPLTHDLFKNVLELLSSTLKRVEVVDLRDDTFYGNLVLDHNGEEIEVDSRPSDAIALAVRFSAPIYVASHVMNAAGVELKETEEVMVEGQDESEDKGGAEDSTLDSLKKRLNDAVNREAYEEAARLRDEISKLGPNN